MRWGGVVDELEFASQIMQWKVHGHVDIDSFPGHPLSALLTQVGFYSFCSATSLFVCTFFGNQVDFQLLRIK